MPAWSAWGLWVAACVVVLVVAGLRRPRRGAARERDRARHPARVPVWCACGAQLLAGRGEHPLSTVNPAGAVTVHSARVCQPAREVIA